MARINLRDYDSAYYKKDCFVEVPDEIAAIMSGFKRDDAAYLRQLFRYKAHYSLDRGDGIENDVLLSALSPYEEYERKLERQQVYAAIASLPDKQAKRVYAHFFLGISKAEIARIEGVNEGNVRKSIKLGLENMAIFLKKYF